MTSAFKENFETYAPYVKWALGGVLCAALASISAYYTVTHAQDKISDKVELNVAQVSTLKESIRELRSDADKQAARSESVMLPRAEFEARWRLIEEINQRLARMEQRQIDALEREVSR